MSARVKYIDCDNRRTAQTDLYCCKCNRDLSPKQAHRLVHWVDGGPFALHPEDEDKYVDPGDGSNMGMFPIGMDCARSLGIEWTTEASQ